MVRQRGTKGYADRLAQALARGPRPMSVRALTKAMHDQYEGLRGTSYGGIRQYAEDKVRSPRIELLRAIADVLGIRWEWLAFNEGKMTEKEQQISDLVEDGVARDADVEAAEGLEEAIAGVREGFGEGAERLLDTAVRRAVILHSWQCLTSTVSDASDTTNRALACRLGEVLAAAPRIFGVDLDSLPDDSLTDYAVMATSAVRHLYPESSAPFGRLGVRSTEDTDAEA
ncbi:MAG: hypothetical protein WEG36_11345 [Gemmatimonadota bacterium]